jgi:hypothetical protein
MVLRLLMGVREVPKVFMTPAVLAHIFHYQSRCPLSTIGLRPVEVAALGFVEVAVDRYLSHPFPRKAYVRRQQFETDQAFREERLWLIQGRV